VSARDQNSLGEAVQANSASAAAGKPRDVIVLGGGGHGRVVIDLLQVLGRKLRGVIDRDPSAAARLPAGAVYLGGDEAIEGLASDSVVLANGLGSVGRIDARRRIFADLRSRGFRFVTLRHPSAIVAADVVIGEGSQIMAGSVLQTGTRIGANVIVNTRASVDHDCEIGDHCHIAPGVVLSGGVRIGAATHIGTAAAVTQNVVIGSDAVIGAGAIVVRDIAAGSSFVGPR
jgi:UDP-perosamine 4-acetyltransferase